jgi:TetR/AcrR family transcriptional regulator, regulator of cefoperazone and chloramphenicol sensitivity
LWAGFHDEAAMSESALSSFPLVGDALAPGLSPAYPHPELFDDAKVRLILAGETLFAERSIEAVSLREIAVLAGNGNNNAVQYHFGDKDGLVQAIFAYRVWQMDEPRLRGLERLEAEGGTASFRALLELLCLPMLDLTNDAGRHSYAAFVTKYMLGSRPGGVPHAMDSRTRSTEALRRLTGAIEAQLRHLPRDLIVGRIAAAYLMFVNMLVRSDNDNVSAMPAQVFAARIEDCLTMATAVLEAPYAALKGREEPTPTLSGLRQRA